MSTTFLKLTTGTRIVNYLGLVMHENKQFITGKNYLHLDIPLSAAMELEVKRGQHVFIEAAGSINVKGREIFLVEPNSALAEYGQVQGSYFVHPDSGEQKLGFWFTAHKSADLSELKYCVRIYMVG